MELAAGTLPGGQSHSPDRAAERAGGHRPQPAHGAAHFDPGRHRQSTTTAPTGTPCATGAHAPAGMLVQLDGSHHAWLEDQGPKFALLLAVDDATGTVVNAVFRTGEDTRGYFMLLEGLIQRWGIPPALYSDLHAVFKHNARRPETAAEATQFTRGLPELGIRRSSPARPRPRSLSHKSGALKSIDFLTPIYASKMALSDVFPTIACRRASKSVWLVLHETRPEAL